jgi:hypothetical protein
MAEASSSSSAAGQSTKRLVHLRNAHAGHLKMWAGLVSSTFVGRLKLLHDAYPQALQTHPDLAGAVTGKNAQIMLDALLERDFPTLYARHADALREYVDDMLRAVESNMQVRVIRPLGWV